LEAQRVHYRLRQPGCKCTRSGANEPRTTPLPAQLTLETARKRTFDVKNRNDDRWNKAVAAVVSASRRDADLGQQDVADRIGMSRNTLVRVESGQRPMTIPELMAFAKALKLSPTVLIDLIVRWHR
jgi:ribosome-binding protein aMBF1 (putative translation factor)